MGACARYQTTPKESHLKVAKRIIRYVYGTSDFSLWYLFDSNPEIAGYSDADKARDIEDQKSTSGGCFYVKNSFISWHSKKQNSISLSTAEAEYIVAESACTQLLWIKQMLKDYGIVQGTMSLFVDNLSAIKISKNLVKESGSTL